jgi:2-amino-4-hydroxy-6-hydroxymethyldihydropteridine diphosphokinase
MAQPERVYVALGSNLGDRVEHLAHARKRLAALPGTTLVAASVIEETAPLGPVPQGLYLNQMLLLETTLAPAELLRYGQLIELERGRERRGGVRWGPRTLDLDIVRFGDRNVRSPGLTIPHPQLDARDFWQRELAELDALLPATHG